MNRARRVRSTKAAADDQPDAGFVLVAVLLGIGVLAALSAVFVHSAATSVRIAANMAEEAKAEALASGGARMAALELVHLMEGRESRVNIGGIYHCRQSGTGSVLQLIIEDEGGKVDINTASDELIEALLSGFGASPSDARLLVARIADFRDADDVPRVGGAEAPEYNAAGLDYGPKNAAFDSIEELEQVLGVPSWLFARAAPYITVHSRRSGVDPSAMAEALVSALAGGQGSALNRADSGKAFAERQSPPDAAMISDRSRRIRADFLTTSSRLHFRILATARLESGLSYTRDAIVGMAAQRGVRPAFERWTPAAATILLPEASVSLPAC